MRGVNLSYFFSNKKKRMMKTIAASGHPSIRMLSSFAPTQKKAGISRSAENKTTIHVWEPLIGYSIPKSL